MLLDWGFGWVQRLTKGQGSRFLYRKDSFRVELFIGRIYGEGMLSFCAV